MDFGNPTQGERVSSQDPYSTPTKKWDMRFLRLCEEIASWSKDPSTQVGSVIVRPDRTIATMGYNGFPRGFSDNPGLYEDRDKKYKYVVHAEANAIVSAREPLHNYTLYCSLMPCQDCTKLAIQAGIRRFVAYSPSAQQLSRLSDSFNAAEQMIMETGCTATWYPRFNVPD